VVELKTLPPVHRPAIEAFAAAFLTPYLSCYTSCLEGWETFTDKTCMLISNERGSHQG